MRFKFPASDKANILVNFPEHGGHMEIVGDHTVRGMAQDSRAIDGAYFVAEFSNPFAISEPSARRLVTTKGGASGKKISSPARTRSQAPTRGLI